MHISTISLPTQPLLKPNSSQVQQHFNPNKPRCRWRQNCTTVIRCCSKKSTETVRTENYYDLLGISVDSNPKAIKEAYRNLQKKHHPDIAGKKGHEYTLMLNQAYHVLMRENLRKDYDASIGKMRGEFAREYTGSGYSSWNGPMRPQALFVDETACVGCRECVHHANNTFMMDETVGCARVKVQYGDDGQKIEVAVESCPVNCIHWVDKEELAVLEFLSRPRAKEAYGMFGGGWDRPSNVFMAAKFFIKQLKERESSNKQKNGNYSHHFTVTDK
ncbi:hypothetical protein AQUCO_00200048v1 [Aquilegia coerulea]|uniref:J domain-containing protein n=1 Tax=Aquilegia coerulea TaxID=218851 RepID=A0A2G5F1B9_AQUCA|nr:hypothetical protein AQUCO_00200048v1 [Aquilegia coerulea]